MELKTNLKAKPSELHVLCKDVQHPDHLWEDEDTMASLLQPHKQFVEQDQLATALHKQLHAKQYALVLHQDDLCLIKLFETGTL